MPKERVRGVEEFARRMAKYLPGDEWSGSTWEYETCPWCHGFKDKDWPAVPGRYEYEPHGHKADCEWKVLMEQAKRLGLLEELTG